MPLTRLKARTASPYLYCATAPNAPAFVRDAISFGAGPRASQFLILGAKARAILDGRFAVSTDDVAALARPTLQHRLILNYRAEAEGQEVTTLPATALLQSGDDAEVWVVSEDNQVHRRAVELLEFDMESVVVGAGLAPGEMVVTAGVNSLADGQDVKPETEIQ